MKKQVQFGDHLYGEEYASIYNSWWKEKYDWVAVSDFYIRAVKDLLCPSDNWLDVGCGTGHLLSRFPHVNRAGLDRSAAMLEKARSANPQATFYQQSMIEKNTELEGKFDLVTSTGQPYCYLRTMEDVELYVERLAEWTAKEGKCMIDILDIVDVVDIEYPKGLYDFSQILPRDRGTTLLGTVWTHREHDDTFNYQLTPQMDVLVSWFARYFRKIEILVRPRLDHVTRLNRRMIVASEKREIGDETQATVIVPTDSELYDVRSERMGNIARPLAEVSNKELLKEIAVRLKSGTLVKAVLRKIMS